LREEILLKVRDFVSATILVVVEDLLFFSKIQQTAKLAGVAVSQAARPALTKKLVEDLPSAVILDLNSSSFQPLEVIRTLRAEPNMRHIPVLGFVSHVQSALLAAAREAGCDVVLARSALVRQLPQLLRDLASGTGGRSQFVNSSPQT
jgi:CheY-like chemotaxis protein